MYVQDPKESIPLALGEDVLNSSPRKHTRDALKRGMFSFRSVKGIRIAGCGGTMFLFLYSTHYHRVSQMAE